MTKKNLIFKPALRRISFIVRLYFYTVKFTMPQNNGKMRSQIACGCSENTPHHPPPLSKEHFLSDIRSSLKCAYMEMKKTHCLSCWNNISLSIYIYECSAAGARVLVLSREGLGFMQMQQHRRLLLIIALHVFCLFMWGVLLF